MYISPKLESSVGTAQKTQSVSVIKTDQIIQHIYEYCSQYNCLLTIKTASVVTVSHIFRPKW